MSIRGKEGKYVAFLIFFVLISLSFLIYSTSWEIENQEVEHKESIEYLENIKKSYIKSILKDKNKVTASDDSYSIDKLIGSGLLTYGEKEYIVSLKNRIITEETTHRKYIAFKNYILISETIVLLLSFIGLSILQKDLS